MENAANFSLAELFAALGPAARRFDIDLLTECASTNTQLLDRAEAGAPSGSVIVCERQTAGRGRRGRTWFSAPGDSLSFSLLWRFPESSCAPAALSLTVGVALARGLNRIGASGIELKWPNDLQHAGRKLGGVLVELLPGNLHCAVIGIGLNLRLPANLPPDVAAVATSLDRSLEAPQPERVLAALLSELATTLDVYAVSGFSALRAAWLERHAHQNLPVRISGDGVEEQGTCAGVDEDGALLLSTAAGLRRIISGEVSLRPS